MTDECMSLIEAPSSARRVIGRIRGATDGPTVIILTAIHGNEPAGLEAARRVLSRMESDGPAGIRGQLVVLAGNLTALRDGTRFVERDLNRQWTPAKVARIRAGSDDPAVEAREQRQLIKVLDELVEQSEGRIHFLDLHTSSADGPPFLTVGDTLVNRNFALQMPLPLILGLEEQVDGALLEFLNNRGVITMGVEAGHHDHESSVDRHEAVLWLTLATARMLVDPRRAELGRFRRLLAEASGGIPRVIEVTHRHAIDVDDRFRMEPGFCNFQRVSRGTLLAHDGNGPIHAELDGLILLPLYQAKGDDGFFLSREVSRFWLTLSAVLRHLRLDRMTWMLPGVRRRAGQADQLLVSTRIARWYPLEIFHLFGFRKLRRTSSTLLVSRRRFDLAPPERVRLS